MELSNEPNTWNRKERQLRGKMVILLSEARHMCTKCHKTSDIKFQKCEICKTARYCGRRCQKDDWDHHRTICHENSAEFKQLNHFLSKWKDYMPLLSLLGSSFISKNETLYISLGADIRRTKLQIKQYIGFKSYGRNEKQITTDTHIRQFMFVAFNSNNRMKITTDQPHYLFNEVKGYSYSKRRKIMDNIVDHINSH